MENVLQTTKNVFYLTEHLIHSVKILTEVSIIWDMTDFFFSLWNLTTTFKWCIHHKLKIPICIMAVCQQHIKHKKKNGFYLLHLSPVLKMVASSGGLLHASLHLYSQISVEAKNAHFQTWLVRKLFPIYCAVTVNHGETRLHHFCAWPKWHNLAGSWLLTHRVHLNTFHSQLSATKQSQKEEHTRCL